MRRVRMLRAGLIVALGMTAGCSAPPPLGMLPYLQRGPLEDRPPWLRDLPVQLERYPAPHGWGGDNLAQAGDGAAPGVATS